MKVNLRFSNKFLYFLFLIVFGSTFGIWVPLLFTKFQLNNFNLSVSMYAVPMILSCCSEPLITQEYDKRKKIIYICAIVGVFFVCLIHISLINKCNDFWSTLVSVILMIIILTFYWTQCDSKKLESNGTSSMGGNNF